MKRGRVRAAIRCARANENVLGSVLGIFDFELKETVGKRLRVPQFQLSILFRTRAISR